MQGLKTFLTAGIPKPRDRLVRGSYGEWQSENWISLTQLMPWINCEYHRETGLSR
jgi:hypothetical protein